MRKTIIFFVILFLFSCNLSNNNKVNKELKEKELALKEKELELKEKELSLKENQMNKIQNNSTEEIIQDIREKFKTINSEVNVYRKVKKDLSNSSTEGGELEGFFYNSELRKIIVCYYGETGKSIEEFYFWNGDIFFTFTQDYFYDKPMYLEDSTVEKINENRYYFNNKKLIQWIDSNKIKVKASLFSDKEIEINEKVTKLKQYL